MGAPLLRKKRVLAAKVEGTSGTAEALTATEGTFNVYDLTASSDISFQQRDGQGGSLAKIAGVPGGRGGKFSFKIPLTGGASAPSWMSTFLPGCGFYLNSLVASFESLPPEASSSHTKTLTLGAYIDGKYKQIHGAMGNVKFVFPAGQMAYADFEFTGIWAAPSNVAIIAPTYPSTAPLRYASSATTIGSFTPKLSSLEIDCGNVVVLREDPSTVSGYFAANIVDRMPKGTMDPEETLTGVHAAGVYDPDADYIAQTLRALALPLGTTGNGLAFAAPKLQIVASPSDDDRNGLQVTGIQFALLKSASGGDDELTITSS